MPLKQSKRGNFLRRACFALAIAATAGMVHAKMPADYSPDFESPDYWNEHAMALVEVTVTSGGDHSPIKIVEQFSGGDSWKPPVALSRTDDWFRPRDPFLEGENDKPALIAGDHLLISIALATRGHGMVAAIPLPEKRTETQIIVTCRAIKQARADADTPHAFEQVIQSGDVAALHYYLNYLLSLDAATVSDEVLNQAARLRADTKADTSSRIHASSLLDKIHIYNARADDWNWLAATLKNENTLTQDQFAKLIGDLRYSHDERRGQMIDLLSELEMNPARPVALRQALSCEDFFSLYDGKSPANPVNLKVLDLYLRLLPDSDPSVRRNAATMLMRAMDRLSADRQPTFQQWAQKAIDALQAAADKETDADVRGRFVQNVEQVRGMIRGSAQTQPVEEP